MDKITEINDTTVCLLHTPERFKGVFFGQHPFTYPTTLLLFQISLFSSGAAILHFFLTPLGQGNFISQFIAGLVLGPSVLGKTKLFDQYVFSPQSFIVGNVYAYFGIMLFLFLFAVKTDLSMLRKPGNKAMAIGFSVFSIPLLLNLLMAMILRHSTVMSPSLRKSLYWVATLQCMTSFHIIICFLDDIKLLNTEIGRLASSSSMISGTISWAWIVIFFTLAEHGYRKWTNTLSLMCIFVLCLVLLVVYVLRPIMLWMVRLQFQERTMKEGYLMWVFVMIMATALYSEFIGQHYLFGPTILGVAIPSGPPLGSTLVTKLESFVSYLMTPLYVAFNTAWIDFSLIHARTAGIIGLLEFTGIMWKIIATVVPCIYFRMSIHDALHLGLIMSTQGIVDVLYLGHALHHRLIDRETYSVMVMSAVIFTTITSPMVKFLYKPSDRFATYKRTIQHVKPHGELRILACVHHQAQTPSIINLIEVTSPSLKTPICLYVIHFIELVGRAAPVFIAHHHKNKTSSQSTPSEYIKNAFRMYETQADGIMVYPFTSISPYKTMHNEVCGFAIDKKVSLLILPFHKLMNIHASEVSANAIRTVNLNILKRAPCSIGIFVDRSSMKGNIHISASRYAYSIGVLFLGGEDDREALAYGSRMANHSNVALTVVHFIDSNVNEWETNEVEQDLEMIAAFKHDHMNSTNCIYEEEKVKDSIGLVNGIKKVQNLFDLILVGRRHSVRSTLLVGLKEWNEFPELGVIGDMLTSSDSYCKVSVLVVQQQCFVDQDTLDSPKYLNEDSEFKGTETTVKVWPIP